MSALAALLLAALAAGVSIANVQVEHALRVEAQPAELEAPWPESSEASSPVQAPVQAWQTALSYLPQGTLIRRIAFAGHGMFVFYSPTDGREVWAIFLRTQGQGYIADDPEPRDAKMCQAPGVAADRILPALRRLLLDPSWTAHRTRLDTLILECHASQLEWTLMPVPEGGYQAGVAIPTYTLPFIDND